MAPGAVIEPLSVLVDSCYHAPHYVCELPAVVFEVREDVVNVGKDGPVPQVTVPVSGIPVASVLQVLVTEYLIDPVVDVQLGPQMDRLGVSPRGEVVEEAGHDGVEEVGHLGFGIIVVLPGLPSK